MSAFDIGRRAYYADFKTAPLWIVIATIAAAMSPGVHAGLWLLFAFAGFAAWTLVEYGVHRFLFHGWLRKDHMRHHRTPAAFIAAPAWFTNMVFPVLLAAVAWLGGPNATGAFVGLLASYLVYIFVHDALHHPTYTKSLILELVFNTAERRHTVHHDGDVRRNFGIAFPLWDIVFGTHAA